MTFLSPLYLLGALAAAIPIVLHFLHRQPELRVKFAAVRLLRSAPVEDTRKRRIREWLLLALRVASLVLIALAFARPFFPAIGASSSSGLTVVLLDTSLSMSAPGQFERARALASDAVRKASSGSLVGVITFADGPQTAARPSVDRAAALAAIDAASAGFGATRYRPALAAASQMMQSAGARVATLVIVTDMQASGWDASNRAPLPEGARVDIADVGAPHANVAVTSAELRGDRVVATVRSSGSAPRDVHVSLAVDGRHVSDATAPMTPGESVQVELAGARGETAAVSVDDPDGIQGDNVRYLLLGDGGARAALIVTMNGDLPRDAFYLEQAIVAQGAGERYQAQGIAASALGAWDASRRNAVVVLQSTRGLDAKGRALISEYVRSGGGLFVAAGPDVDGDVVTDILGGAVSVEPPSARPDVDRHLAPADFRHPLFQAFGSQAATLGLVTFRHVTPIGSKRCTSIATFTGGGPALLDCSVGDGRALVFASDLDDRGNDFPRHAAFVPFVHESLRYLASGEQRSASMLVGEVPPGIPRRPGVAEVKSQGSSGTTRRVAVNVDPDESLPERISPDQFQSAVTRLRDEGRSAARVQQSDVENREHVWQYALVLAIGALLAESFVSMRAA